MSIRKAIGLIGFYLFAEKLKNRFAAGDTIDDAVKKAKFYKARGEKSVINILGEHAKDRREADCFCEQIIELILLLSKEGLTDVNVAEKPSQIGMDISEFVYLFNKARILKAAQAYLPHASIETDAEDHFYSDKVIRIAIELSKCYANQVLACQINKKEAAREIQLLQSVGIPVRICKGNAYKGDIQKEEDLRKIYLEIASAVIPRGEKTAIATHDLFLIDSLAENLSHKKDKFEFELLMGIEEKLSKKPHLREFTFRRYIPLGPDWRPYAKRRAEVIVNIILRNFWYKTVRFLEKNLQYAGDSF